MKNINLGWAIFHWVFHSIISINYPTGDRWSYAGLHFVFSPAVAAAGGGQQVPKRSEIFSASSNSTGGGMLCSFCSLCSKRMNIENA